MARCSIWLRLTMLTLVISLVPAAASAEAVKCTIRTMHGLSSTGGLDKKLAFLNKQLTRPPFSAYKTIKLLSTQDLLIPMHAVKQLTLPSGKVLKLTYKEKLLERKKQVRLRLHLSITPPKQTRYLPGTLYTIADRGTLLVAGDPHKGGVLVVGITCQHQ